MSKPCPCHEALKCSACVRPVPSHESSCSSRCPLQKCVLVPQDGTVLKLRDVELHSQERAEVMWVLASCSGTSCHGPATSISTLLGLWRLAPEFLRACSGSKSLVPLSQVGDELASLAIVRQNMVLWETCQRMGRAKVASFLVLVKSVFIAIAPLINGVGRSASNSSLRVFHRHRGVARGCK